MKSKTSPNKTFLLWAFALDRQGGFQRSGIRRHIQPAKSKDQFHFDGIHVYKPELRDLAKRVKLKHFHD